MKENSESEQAKANQRMMKSKRKRILFFSLRKRMKMKFENLFELEQAKDTNILVSGANASGKTRLACGIASILHRLGFKVIVIDVSGAWKTVSDLPFYAKAYRFKEEIAIPQLETSGIYDLSDLKLSESRKIVEQISSEIWNSNPRKPTWLFLEEAETYLKNIRGLASEEIYRLVHVGRNRHIRTVLLTTDLALIDTSTIRLSGIRFHGFLNIEENSKRKFKAYYGKDYTRIAIEGLDAGDFIRLHKRKLDVISVDLFESKRKAKLYVSFEQTEQPQQTQYKQLNILQEIKMFLKSPLF